MTKETVEITFKNVSKNQEIVATITHDEKINSCDVNLVFVDSDANEHQGMHVAYLDVLMKGLFGNISFNEE